LSPAIEYWVHDLLYLLSGLEYLNHLEDAGYIAAENALAVVRIDSMPLAYL
jgi:hypothetical protein